MHDFPMEQRHWRAGFELEVILGDLGEDRFADYMDCMGPMDTATPAFCQSVAKRLTEATGMRWSAPKREFPQPGFYVVPEYNLDPLDWPRDRCAGVELLTPPLPFTEAEGVRASIADAILEMDEGFDPFPSELGDQCAWHINIDAGPADLDPTAFSLAVDELPILARNGRCFTPYTAIQRHAYGPTLLRHLAVDPGGPLLADTGLNNVLRVRAGRGKRYAANFDKLQRGYVELRHFGAATFFGGESLAALLEPASSAFELPRNGYGPFETALLAKFLRLANWLAQHRERIEWSLRQSVVYPVGEILFAGEELGQIDFNGTVDMSLLDATGDIVATIRDLDLADVAEGVALLALDLVELRAIGLDLRTRNQAFNRAVASLGKAIRSASRAS